MDFKITAENMDSSIESYENIAEKIIDNMDKVKKAIDDLTDDSWNGLSSNAGKAQFELWTNKCDDLEKRINDFKDVLKEKEISINNLFNQGKSLKI